MDIIESKASYILLHLHVSKVDLCLICNYYIIDSIPPINSLLDGVGGYHKSDAFRLLKHDLNLVFVRKSYGHVE